MITLQHKKTSRAIPFTLLKCVFIVVLIPLFLQGCGTERELTKEQMAVRQGKELYQRSCASCHGASANGLGGRSGPSLQGPDYLYGGTREQLHHSIKQGQPHGMPAFASIYSDAQIDNIISYLLFLIK